MAALRTACFHPGRLREKFVPTIKHHTNLNDTLMLKHLLKCWMGVFLAGSLGLAACETDDVEKAPAPGTPPPSTTPPSTTPPANPPATPPGTPPPTTPPANPPPPAGGVEAGTVMGKVVDTQGRPMAGAKVRIENDFHYYDVTTNAEGVYKSPTLTIGGFKAVAWARITYKGQTYTLRMGMARETDYDFFDPENGAVRDFKWQISGRIPDREDDGGTGYFGGTLRFSNGTGSIYDERMQEGDQVHVTLNPTGPLIDGSTGRQIKRTFTITYGNESYNLTDIPAGEYEVSAVRVVPGAGQERLMVGSFSKQSETATFAFQPGTYGTGTYESGLKAASLYLTLDR